VPAHACQSHAGEIRGSLSRLDGAGFDTRVIIAYWPNAESFAGWRRSSGFDSWWADPVRETEPLGRFLEVVAPPMDRLEVAYSPPQLPEGAAHLQSRVSACPVAEHAYWGSAHVIASRRRRPIRWRAMPVRRRRCVTAPLGDAMQLRLWHEVMVLPDQAQSFEYINCHERTGLMAAAAA
jgi:hypothetical protein